MSKDRTCPNCGAALMPNDIFCGECGARVQTPAYDIVPDTLPDDVPPKSEEEPVPEDIGLSAQPTAGQHIPPPPAKDKASGRNILRIVVIVAAVAFLLVSLCLCSLGAMLIFVPTESPTTTLEEDAAITTIFCFAPGIISGLLGAGAAYLGFKKR
jgi:uncharacterized Zn finger protein (UPF0148 family)